MPKFDGFGKSVVAQPVHSSAASSGCPEQGQKGFASPLSYSPRKRRHGKLTPLARKTRQTLNCSDRALYDDAFQQAGHLRQKHRARYVADPRQFRKIVRQAQSLVFRQKPGPKEDRRMADLIGRAARERARGVEWEALYTRYIEGYDNLNPHTRTMAEDGFRRKVNKYGQSQRLRQKPERATETPNPSAQHASE